MGRNVTRIREEGDERKSWTRKKKTKKKMEKL